ncbi:MAG: CRISPR-associated endonuclease Cas2 [Aggregatilineales bacterium]
MRPLILMYDIVDDKARSKIADACMDYGLDRIQYSCFAGHLSHNHAEALMLDIEAILGKKAGNIQLISIAPKDWQNRLEVSNAG